MGNMTEITPEDIAAINSFPKLVSLLRDKMEWPLGEDYGFDDVVYEYDPKELGFKPEETAKIREIHQLRPLVTGQPWGIFFVSFEDKKISVTVLRRMLRALVLKKRSTAQAADRQSWQLHDLIFVANFGGSGEREIAFAHFSENEDTGDLPVMKVLGWNAKDTKLHNKYVGEVLRQRLIWPEDHTNVKTWRETWREAFELRQGEAIQTSKDLAIKLAELAIEIRARANQLLALESESGPMRQMHEAFRKNLIHDLDADGFADMFAQTISYGMLAAKISRPGADLIADNLADMVPRTNPFLKELFGSFLSLGGRDKRKGMDFDELGVNDVVDMLNVAKMDAVLRDFGDKNPKEDPVIHFYELFLKEYDPEKRVQRGVFYTPRPVVSFIVRGVDEVLRTEFDLPLGLADTSTWGELAARNDKVTIPEHIDPQTPFVQILDPATGTGTFIVETIDLIYTRMIDHWEEQKLSKTEIADAWNNYVPNHLLPRLTAFELMMAPYAIAHMKVGLKLSETGYTFSSDERARIFLTNALEPARDLDMEFIFMSEALAHEAAAANDAKEQAEYTAIIGNPPYSLISGNLTSDNRALVEPYKYVAGERIQERGALQFEKILNDDCIKFFALGQNFINSASLGVLSFISNNNFVDSLVLRGMRWSNLQSAQSISIFDLGGSVKRGSGGKDENVFDIQQGVCIGRFIKTETQVKKHVVYAEITGSRDSKLNFLLKNNFSNTEEREVPISKPFFFFNANHNEHGAEYFDFTSTKEILKARSIGFFSSKDPLVISYDKKEVIKKVHAFNESELSNEALCKSFGIGAKKAWNVTRSRAQLSQVEDISKKTVKFKNRLFDSKYVFYDRSLIWSMAWPINQHMIGGQNLAFTISRQLAGNDWRHVFCSDTLVELCYLTNKTKEGNHVYPLWLFDANSLTSKRPNIDRPFALAFGASINLTYQDGIPRGGQPKLGDEFRLGEQDSMSDGMWDGRGDLKSDFGPRDLFDYIYAVLHSPIYRERYAEFLKSDFPRIPTPQSRGLFATLIPLGQELVSLHLVKSDETAALHDPDIRFAGNGEARVEKGFPKYENGKVMINESRWFEDVPNETWEFHIGGYRVCHKWLKDRAAKGGANPKPGRILTDDDILHYRRIVTALTETRRIMAEIDRVIESHGGWPDAFAQGDETQGDNQ